jgi:hypothetical protein
MSSDSVTSLSKPIRSALGLIQFIKTDQTTKLGRRNQIASVISILRGLSFWF